MIWSERRKEDDRSCHGSGGMYGPECVEWVVSNSNTEGGRLSEAAESDAVSTKYKVEKNFGQARPRENR